MFTDGDGSCGNQTRSTDNERILFSKRTDRYRLMEQTIWRN